MHVPRVFGASVAGAAHVSSGTECQDRFAIRLGGDGIVIAVADGLGSAPLSALGASEAVDAAVGAGAAMLGHPSAPGPETVAAAMPAFARVRLERRTAEGAWPLKHLGCTLVAIAVRGTSACVAHVGDGAVVALTGAGWVLASPPARAEYANVVDPLTADGWVHALRVSEVVSDVRFIAAFTDGCHHAILRPDGCDGVVPHAGFLDPVAAFAAQTLSDEEGAAELEALLGGAKLGEHSDDDKTLVVAWIGPFASDPPSVHAP